MVNLLLHSKRRFLLGQFLNDLCAPKEPWEQRT